MKRRKDITDGETPLFPTLSVVTETRPDRVVAQHNDLVRAQYDMSLLEWRLFVAMMARINKGDKEFSICRIPVSELYPDSDVGGKTYSQVKKAVMRLVGRTITVETKDAKGIREVVSNPLMATMRYKEGTGFVIAQFNNFVKPYLLELKGDFTTSQELTLMSFRSFYSFRFYSLLKSYSYLKDTVVLDLEKMKYMLNLTDRYNNFADFKRFVLDIAQAEIAHTDVAFEYTTLKDGKQVTGIQFDFLRPAVVAQLEIELPEGIQQQLNEVGMTIRSLQEIKSIFSQGKLTEEYFRFVLDYYNEDKHKGRIRNRAGAIFTALTKDQLKKEFEIWKANKPVYKAPTPKKEVRAQQQTEDRFKRAMEALIDHPEWMPQVEAHLQKGLLGHFYKKDQNLAENLRNPALTGPFFQIMESLLIEL